jgi:subfamily B ATP-binding cassette protein MsbA
MELYRRLLKYLRPYHRQFFLALFFMLIVALTTAGTALLVRPILDDIFMSKMSHMLWPLTAGIIALYVLKGWSTYVQAFKMKKIGQAVVRDIRNDLFAHLQKLSLSFYHKHSTGSIISRFVNDILLVQESVTMALASLLRDSLTIICLVGVIFYRDWRLAVIAVVVLPAALYPITRFGRTSRRVGKKSQVQMGALSSILHESATGAKVVRAFTMEEGEIERFRAENSRLYSLYLKMKRVEALSPAVMEVLGSLGAAGVVLFGGYQVINGTMTAGTFFSFLTAVLLLYQPIKRLATVNNRIQEALSASDRIFAVLDIEPEIVDREGAGVLEGVRDGVTFGGVTFGYGGDKVLENLELEVAAGEKVAIVGASGAGKSTLVNLVPRFYDPVEGAVLVDGTDIRDVTLKSLRTQIGLVTQETILFNDTIYYNIARGRPGAAREEVEAAARAAYAHDFITSLSGGYETVVGERGLMISGGERQRICIARAILKDAPILILDEATSALDSEAASIVQDALGNLLQGKTAFIIAHSFATVLKADRIAVLDEGRIVQQGSHQELMEKSPLYRRLYELQFQDQEELPSPPAGDR